jgi:hypothetical protein
MRSRAPGGTTALIWAAYNSDASRRALIAAGADRRESEFGALRRSRNRRLYGRHSALLARGEQRNLGETPLMAARTGNVEAAKLLGADANAIEQD